MEHLRYKLLGEDLNTAQAVVVQEGDCTVVFKRAVYLDLDDMFHAREMLWVYMRNQSRDRWSAGWFDNLHMALLGDACYEWLVDAVGGWWQSTFRFVPGTVKDLKKLHTMNQTTGDTSHGTD